MSTDRILKEIGECGRYQLFASVLVSTFTFIPAIHTVMPVYTTAMRNFWCTDWVNRSISELKHTPKNDTTVFNRCSITLISDNKSRSAVLNSSQCSHWEFDQSQFQSTIVSQYRLVCDREYLLHLGTLIYMLSYLSGCTLWGYISDRIGRTLTLVVAALVTGPASTLTCFIDNYLIYLILRAVVAFGCSAYLPTGATYISEIVTAKYKTLFVVNVFGNGFPMGCCFLVFVVYIIRNHIHIQAIASALSFMPLLFFPIIQESPRWLLSKSKYGKAYKVCRYISVFNSSVPLSRDIFEKLCEQHIQLEESSKNDEETVDNPVVKRAFSELVTRRKVLFLLILMGYNFFASSFLYFALILGTAELGGDIFLTLLLMSLLEILSHAVSSVIGAKYGNVGIVLVSFTLSGLSVIVSGLLQHYSMSSIAVVTFSIIGRFFISAAFTMQFNLVSGLFPTWARNFTLGFCLALSRIGSLFGALIFLTKNIWHPLPFLILGFSALIAAILNLIYLPEIHRKPLPESMDQTEALAEFRRFPIIKCCKSADNIEVFEKEIN